MSQPQSGEAPSGERLRGKGSHWCNCKKHYVIHACGALALECEVLQKERYSNILLPALYLLMSLPSECQSLSANQISSRYLYWRLRYNYFRFRNTNVRHVGILLLVSISTISP